MGSAAPKTMENGGHSCPMLQNTTSSIANNHAVIDDCLPHEHLTLKAEMQFSHDVHTLQPLSQVANQHCDDAVTTL
jgi:hypothetical protein